jgi:hypothetical protein
MKFFLFDFLKNGVSALVTILHDGVDITVIEKAVAD